MVEAGRGGAIVNLASVAMRGAPLGVHYSASKAGVMGLTRAMALALAPTGSESTRSPRGSTDTAQPRYGNTEAELVEMGRQIPLEGRMATPDEIARVAVFLAGRGVGLDHRPDHPRERRRLHGRIGDPMRYRWPDGQQCAVVLSFDFDAESGFLFREPDKAKRSLAGLEERRFGPRVGVDRILRMLDQLRLPATFYIPGWTVENHRPQCPRIRDAGHEIGAHGNIHEAVDGLDAAQEEAVMKRAAARSSPTSSACGRPAIGRRPGT